MIESYLTNDPQLAYKNIEIKIKRYFNKIIESFFTANIRKPLEIIIDNETIKVRPKYNKVNSLTNKNSLFLIYHNDISIVFGLKVMIDFKFKELRFIPSIYEEKGELLTKGAEEFIKYLDEIIGMDFNFIVDDNDVKEHLTTRMITSQLIDENNK